jgi:glycosyltransferase involved in cell wall biosynthesis
MKIALLCTGYSLDPKSPSLPDELAQALVRAGHEVSVFVVNWSRQRLGAPRVHNEGALHVLMVDPIHVPFGPESLRKAAKWLFSSASLLTALRRYRRANQADLVIGFSPAVSMLLPIVVMTGFSRAKSFLVQWDFFPTHHAEIGLLSGRALTRGLKIIESLLMRRFNVIGCMSKKNADYLRANYRLAAHQEVVELPIWSSFPTFTPMDRSRVRQRYELPTDLPLLIFGGQMSKGRGIEDVLAVARCAQQTGLHCGFLFVGDGEQVALIHQAVLDGATNVFHLKGVQRDEYLSLLSACDVGIVSTVRGVSVPTFPSKTLDYINVGIPIIAAVERATDYGEFVSRTGIGLSVEAGAYEDFVHAIREILASGHDSAWNQRDTFMRAREVFKVEHVARRLVDYVYPNASFNRDLH